MIHPFKHIKSDSLLLIVLLSELDGQLNITCGTQIACEAFGLEFQLKQPQQRQLQQ
jgi:hypothetical protein